MKYLVYVGEFGSETPLVFDERTQHDSVVYNKKILSAGFFSLDELNRKAITYGESVSLNMRPAEIDSWLLTKMFYPN